MTTLYPAGYGTSLITLDRMRELHEPRLHPAMGRRFFPWIESMGGLIGVGSGWRTNPHNVSAASRAGRSFHQDQKYKSGFVGYAAFDLVARNPGRIHRSPTWAESDTAPKYGLHTFVSGEPWHMQCIEMRGYQTWVDAGRPDPAADFKLPGRPDFPEVIPPPQGGDDMLPLAQPERAYDSRPSFQNEVDDKLAAANAAVPKTPFAAGETRQIVVGMCSQVFVNVTVVGTKGWVKVHGTPEVPTGAIVNSDADGVANGSAPVLSPNGTIFVTTQKACDIIVDVFARG